MVVNDTRSSLMYFLNDPDYNIMAMSDFLGLAVPEGQKENRSMMNWDVVKFNYPDINADHYIYREGGVYNHNSMSHYGRNVP